MKEAGNRFLLHGSLGPGARLARRQAVFAFCLLSVQAPSHPPGVVVDMDI